MQVNLDVNPQFVPPPGKWRVVEFGPGAGATGATVIGPLRHVIGDYDFREAMDLAQLVHWPYTRTVFNDMGVRVTSSTPGPGGDQPQAGVES